MGRLVDADALLEHIKKLECHAENKKYEQGLNDFLQCYLPQIIDNQPTAYDVEKVLEELADNSRFIDDINEHNIKCISCVIGQKTAIDIVKRGGVE